MADFIFAGASSAMAQQARQQLQSAGHRVIGISRNQDVQGYDALYAITDYCTQYPKIEGELSGLVYFPGSINLKPFARITASEFENEWRLHTLGAITFLQNYHKQIKNGSVVLLSTVAVQTGMPFHSSVAMVKGALEGLTRALAAEWAPNIRVNAIAPSLVETPMAQRFLSTEEKLEQIQKRHPLKRHGTVQDIANAIEFLLTDKSSWMSGTVLQIDGGMSNLKL